MVKFYLLQIRLGKISLVQVPERYRAQVEKEVEKSDGNQ